MDCISTYFCSLFLPLSWLRKMRQCEEMNLYSSSESLNSVGEIEEWSSDEELDPEWPDVPMENEGVYVFCCLRCFHPIVHLNRVIEIMDGDDIVIGLALPTRCLLYGVICSNENRDEPWRTRVCCPYCFTALSLLEELVDPGMHGHWFGNIFNYRNNDEQYINLIPSFLHFGTIGAAHDLHDAYRIDYYSI